MTNREDFTHFIVESDSKLLIDMVTRSCKLNKHTSILVRHIQDLALLHGNIAFKHTCREGSRCADWLPNFSFNQNSYNVRILESPLKSFKISFLMTYPKLECREMFK